MRRPPVLALLLILATALLYWRVHDYEFINYDDPDYVTKNSYVTNGITAEGLSWAFGRMHGEATYWHPVTWLSHMTDCEVFGVDAGWHHLGNVLFHAINAALVFVLLHQMTGALWPSWFVAALFAFHPLQVDTVAWVTERKNVLSTMFWMLTLIAWGRCVGRLKGLKTLNGLNASGGSRGSRVEGREQEETRREGGKPERSGKADKERSTSNVQRSTFNWEKWGWYAAALVFFALGLMSKPMLVTVPCVMLLLDYWPLQRLTLGASRFTFHASRLVAEKIPFFIMSVISSYITIKAHLSLGAAPTVLPLTLRIENAVVSYARYILKTVWPAKLSVFYPHPGEWPNAVVFGSLLLLIAVTLIAIWNLRRRPYLAVGWFWFLGTLTPTIGIIYAGMQAMADRFVYVPLIGLFIMASWGIRETFMKIPNGSKIAGLLGSGALAGCLVVTSFQLSHWRNSRTLFEHAQAVTKQNFLATTIVGALLAQEGKTQEAVQHFEKSLKDQPDFPATHFNLGNVYFSQTNYDKAIEAYQKALQEQPTFFDARMNLSRAFHLQGRLDAAITNYSQAVKQRPQSADAQGFLGTALLESGKAQEAIPHLEEALRLKPEWILPAKGLGGALVQLGKTAEAARRYEMVVKNWPEDAEAHTILAQLYAESGRIDDALREYREALRAHPDFPGAMNNLSWLLATHPDDKVRNGKEAVRLAERANELVGRKIPTLLGTLAAAYAEAGSFDQAVKTGEEAAALAETLGEKEIAARNRELAQQYREKKPYREKK